MDGVRRYSRSVGSMKRLIRGIVLAVVGYLLCAVVGYGLVLQFSPRHDRALEASMTSVFFYGPVGSALSFAIGVLLPMSCTRWPRRDF
jgi:hypothetical protein